MSLSALEALFLEGVSAAVHGRRVHWEALSPELWPGLFRLAETQKLLPLLADAVSECPGADTDPFCAAARKAARRQVMLQAQKDAAFRPVYEGLRQAGIRALVVKGSLCRTVYPNGALRISADEDLLVPESRFAAACRFLADAGLTEALLEAYEVDRPTAEADVRDFLAELRSLGIL